MKNMIRDERETLIENLAAAVTVLKDFHHDWLADAVRDAAHEIGELSPSPAEGSRSSECTLSSEKTPLEIEAFKHPMEAHVERLANAYGERSFNVAHPLTREQRHENAAIMMAHALLAWVAPKNAGK
jgi:hypothetical protein